MIDSISNSSNDLLELASGQILAILAPHAGRALPLEEYLVTLQLRHTLEEYKTPNTPTAAALAQQLEAIGKSLRPGQRVRFLFNLGDPGVHAWDLSDRLNPQRLDVERYKILFLRAAFTLLQPLSFSESGLKDWLFERERPQDLPTTSFNRVSQHLLPAFGSQESI